MRAMLWCWTARRIHCCRRLRIICLHGKLERGVVVACQTQRTCVVSDSHATAFSVLAVAKDSKVNTIELGQGDGLDNGRRKGA
jgi:hypothetical protein